MLDAPPSRSTEPGPLGATVVVSLMPRALTPAADHLLLRDLVARLAGLDPAGVTLTQRCPTCGMPGHGPLSVQLAPDISPAGSPAGAGRIHVSLARAGTLLAVAVTGAGPVGIDVESLAALAAFPVDAGLCSPVEAAALAALPPRAAAAARAVLWTSKEAVLKAVGVGLRVDPRDLTVAVLAGATGPAALVGWPHAPFPLDRAHLLTVPAPAGGVVTVAVVCARRPRLRMLDAPG